MRRAQALDELERLGHRQQLGQRHHPGERFRGIVQVGLPLAHGARDRTVGERVEKDLGQAGEAQRVTRGRHVGHDDLVLGRPVAAPRLEERQEVVEEAELVERGHRRHEAAENELMLEANWDEFGVGD